MLRLFRLYRDAFSGLPRDVWLVSAAALVTRAGTMVLPFLALYFKQHLGLSALQAGQLVGLYGFGSMAGSYLGGWLSDRIDAIRVQQLSLITGGLGLLLLTRITDFAVLAVAVVVVSTLAEAFRPAVMVSVARFSPPESRTRSFALVRLAVNLGMAIGPAAAGFLAAVNYHWLFVADALTCWAAAVMLGMTLGRRARRQAHRPSSTRHGGRSAFRDGPFLAFLALTTLLGLVFLQIWCTMPLYLKDFYLMSEAGIGVVLALNAVLIVLTEMILLRAVEHRDHMKVAGVGALLVCIGMAVLPLGPAVVVAIASVVIWTVGEMLALPMTNALVAERAGDAGAGRYMGAYTLSFSVSFMIAPVIGTAVYDRLGPEILWYGIGAVGIALLVGFWALSGAFRRRHE